MRILIATPLYPPEIGGPATYAKLLEEGLPKLGIEVELVKFSEVRHLPKLVRHLAYYRRVKKAARTADAIFALDPVSVGLPAMKAAEHLHKPFIVKIVGDYAWEQGQQRFGISQTLDEFVKTKKVPVPVHILRKIQTGVAYNAARVIVPSAYLKEVIVSWGIPREKIQVIYNSVPLEEPGTVPEGVNNLPRPLVVTIGRLVPWKNMDAVIDAVANVYGASLAIVGDGPLRGELENHAKEKLDGRSCVTGMLSHKDTLAVLAACDVFVLNSSYEGLSHLLIEAITLGVPTIATRVGGNPEVITNEENGLLVEPGNTAALSTLLARVVGDTELRARLSVRAKESAKRFSTEAMLNSVAELLKELC